MATAAATRGDATMEVDEFAAPSVDGDTDGKSDDERTDNGKNEAALGDAQEVLSRGPPQDPLRKEDEYSEGQAVPLGARAAKRVRADARGYRPAPGGGGPRPRLDPTDAPEHPPPATEQGDTYAKEQGGPKTAPKGSLRHNLTWSLRAPR